MNGSYAYSAVVVTSPCNSEVMNIEMYPNPTKGLINLSYQLDGFQSGAVSVFYVLGSKVLYTEGFPSYINLDSQPNGIYFVRFTNNSQITIKKLLVKHE